MTDYDLVVLELARSWPVGPGLLKQTEALKEAARQEIMALLGN